MRSLDALCRVNSVLFWIFFFGTGSKFYPGLETTSKFISRLLSSIQNAGPKFIFEKSVAKDFKHSLSLNLITKSVFLLSLENTPKELQ
jgi:hypothetical protein